MSAAAEVTPRYLTFQWARLYSGLSVSTLRRLVAQGTLTAHRPDRQTRKRQTVHTEAQPPSVPHSETIPPPAAATLEAPLLPLSELGRMIADVVAGGASYRDFLLLVAAQTEGALAGARRRR